MKSTVPNYLIIFLYFWLSIASSQSVVKQILIPVGNGEKSINDDGEPFGAGLPNTHFCLDNNLNIFIYDMLDNAIKIYNLKSDYLGSIKTPFRESIQLNCFEKKLYTGRFFLRDNRIFIYNTDSFKLLGKPKQLFNSKDVWDYEQYDSLLIFRIPFNKFHVYDMASEKIFKFADNPFVFSKFSEKEKQFLFKNVLENYNVHYLGKIGDFMVLVKTAEIKNQYIVGLFDIDKMIRKESDFTCRRDGFMNSSLQRTAYLIKGRYLFFMGYDARENKSENDNFISIKVIDLQVLFPDVDFPDVKLF